MSITPPKSDELLERHQFYAQVAMKVSQDENAAQTRSRLHQRVDEVTTTANKCKEQLSTMDTQKRTLLAAIIGVWTVVGGAVTWGFDKVVTKLDSYITVIETQKKKIEELERGFDSVKGSAQAVDNLKASTKQLQSDVDRLTIRVDEVAREVATKR